MTALLLVSLGIGTVAAYPRLVISVSAGTAARLFSVIVIRTTP